MSRKNRPYHFYDTTSSVCSVCLYPVEAKIIFKDNHVYMDKWCPTHGTERVLIMDDADYYRKCREVYVKAPEMPEYFATPMQYGCPYDCGLCPDHMQHSCLSIVEITDVCNLDCPVCFADSGMSRETRLPHLPYRHKSLDTVKAMLDTVVKSEGEPDVVQLSGGEPTLHPQLFEILDYIKTLPIRHVMINTNGIRIAKETEFVAKLAEYAYSTKGQGLEIYLQCDSLKDERIQVLRGASLVKIHEDALANLDQHNLSTTLVATIKKGLNDDEFGDLIEFASGYNCVRGISFQPLSEAGRVADESLLTDSKKRLTISEIRRKIAEQSDIFTLDDIVPVPCNPDTLAMGYGLKVEGNITPLTRYVTPDVIMQGGENTILFEQNPAVQNQAKQHLIKVLSTNHSPESQANCLSELLCCLPKIQAPHLGYDNVFRVMVVQFMDAQNLDIRSLKKSCIHFATLDKDGNGKMIPFESYNLFYRDDKAVKLKEIQTALAKGFEVRDCLEITKSDYNKMIVVDNIA
ncbi:MULTISPECIES: radical SAM protein [unclassified Moraxella]|uniref:radical SAM protein n=1 Tax=unclassified Moraxella TaxID=2685852 RepID=UPI003AF6B80E